MDDQQPGASAAERKPQEETATEAFARLDDRVAELDGRIALMARGVEHMAAERLSIEIPDYNPTLEKTNAHLAAIAKRLKEIEDAPALDMTPEDMGARIAAAARQARERDRAHVERVQQNQIDAVKALRQIIGHARTRQGQREHLLWGIGGGILAGCLLWSILPGVIARTVPETWHWPERIAARTVREPTFWEAGIRMMRADGPQAWNTLYGAGEMWRNNREAISACEQKAARAKKSVRCTINVNARAAGET